MGSPKSVNSVPHTHQQAHMVCVVEVVTYSYTGRAHPSMRNMRPIAPPKDRLMRATGERETDREEDIS